MLELYEWYLFSSQYLTNLLLCKNIKLHIIVFEFLEKIKAIELDDQDLFFISALDCIRTFFRQKIVKHIYFT